MKATNERTFDGQVRADPILTQWHDSHSHKELTAPPNTWIAMILTPEAAQALRSFSDGRGATMLTDRDQVYPERWTRSAYLGIGQFRLRNQIAELPSTLSRADIFLIAQAATHQTAATFLWTMMWGYQNEGTGAYRTDVALRSRNRIPVETRLSNMIASCRCGDIRTAFALMRDPNSRVRNVNTAFGTKLFYFAGYDESKPFPLQPLILDRRVVSALLKTLEDPSAIPSTYRDLTNCTLNDYLWYLDIAARIRDHYVPSHRIDVVEYFLWSNG